MFYSFIRRVLSGCVPSVFMLSGAMAATPGLAEFPVSVAQMQALGVTVMVLKKPGPITGAAYPAQVVVPASGNQIVSAPLAGRVEALLVEEQESVKAGQPLLRLSSPDYSD